MSKKKGAGAPPAESTAMELLKLDQSSQDVYNHLFQKLMAAKTLGELYAVADDDFKVEVARLPEVAQRALRDAFSVQRDVVKHKIKMEEIANQPVTIKEPPDFPPASPDYPDNVFCVVKGIVDATGEKFELISGAIRVLRHFQNSQPNTYPQHLTFYQESEESMHARGAKPVQRRDGTMGLVPMWLVRRNAPAQTTRGSGGIPF